MEGKESAYVTLLNETLSQGWPNDLDGRLKVCNHLISKAKTKGLTKGHQASLASKAIWFKRPKDWFLFDRFVAFALRVNISSNALEKHEAYQRKLHGLDISSLSNSIAQPLKKYDASLHPERVIDKFLMRIGMSFFEHIELDDAPGKLETANKAHATSATAWAPPTAEGLTFARDTYATFASSKIVQFLRQAALP